MRVYCSWNSPIGKRWLSSWSDFRCCPYYWHLSSSSGSSYCQFRSRFGPMHRAVVRLPIRRLNLSSGSSFVRFRSPMLLLSLSVSSTALECLSLGFGLKMCCSRLGSGSLSWLRFGRTVSVLALRV